LEYTGTSPCAPQVKQAMKTAVTYRKGLLQNGQQFVRDWSSTGFASFAVCFADGCADVVSTIDQARDKEHKKEAITAATTGRSR